MSFGVKTTKKTTYFPDEVLYSDSGQVVGYQNLYPVEDRQQTSSPGGSSPSGGVTSLEYGVEGGGSGNGGSVGSPTYVYVPGSAAPTDGDPLSYAGWLQGSTKYQAEQDRIRKEQQAQTDRQRQIVDANSAYMQGRALYGANAERMASMGLTNSGYGEYLMGKAYATQRGEVQNANRTAQQRIDQAIYEEGKIKQQADAKYAEDLIGIKNQQNADYAALYESALKGASIESIMQDSRWGGLSPEKQATITSVTTANSIKIRIDNGESLETIMADPASGWNDLTVDQQNTLNTYSTTKTEAKNAEIASNFERYLTAINNGSATLDDIKALPGWADMVDTDYANQLQAAWNKREHGKKFNELLRNVQNGDLTAETLEKHADWALMDESERDQLLDEIRKGEKTQEDRISTGYYSVVANGYYNVTDVEAALGTAGYSANEIDTIVSKWQQKNYDEIVDNIENVWNVELGSKQPDPRDDIKEDINNGAIPEEQGKKLLEAMDYAFEKSPNSESGNIYGIIYYYSGTEARRKEWGNYIRDYLAGNVTYNVELKSNDNYTFVGPELDGEDVYTYGTSEKTEKEEKKPKKSGTIVWT